MESVEMMHNIMDNSSSYPQCCTHLFSALTAALLRLQQPRYFPCMAYHSVFMNTPSLSSKSFRTMKKQKEQDSFCIFPRHGL